MDPNLIHQLKDAIDEARRENGKVEIDFEGPGKTFIRVFGSHQRNYGTMFSPKPSTREFQLRREVSL